MRIPRLLIAGLGCVCVSAAHAASLGTSITTVGPKPAAAVAGPGKAVPPARMAPAAMMAPALPSSLSVPPLVYRGIGLPNTMATPTLTYIGVAIPDHFTTPGLRFVGQRMPVVQRIPAAVPR